MNTEVKIVFRVYSFEQDKTQCEKCDPPRWLVIANYDCIYFPPCDTCEGIVNTPLKVIVGSYKNLKDAKKALYKGRIAKRSVNFEYDV